MSETPTGYTVSGDGNTTLVSFGGIAMGLGVAPFEFVRSLQDYPLRTIFVRDQTQSWYQNGVEGLGSGIEDTAAALNDVIGATDRKVFIGNSMGGYAALLFGALLKADAVFAFAPQTFIDRWTRIIHRDRRWREQMRSVHKRRDQKWSWNLSATSLQWQDARIYYGADLDLDQVHARKLGGRATLYRVPDSSHDVTRALAARGELAALIANVVRTTTGD